jgi:hypothetical protein
MEHSSHLPAQNGFSNNSKGAVFSFGRQEPALRVNEYCKTFTISQRFDRQGLRRTSLMPEGKKANRNGFPPGGRNSHR